MFAIPALVEAPKTDPAVAGQKVRGDPLKTAPCRANTPVSLSLHLRNFGTVRSTC